MTIDSELSERSMFFGSIIDNRSKVLKNNPKHITFMWELMLNDLVIYFINVLFFLCRSSIYSSFIYGWGTLIPIHIFILYCQYILQCQYGALLRWSELVHISLLIVVLALFTPKFIIDDTIMTGKLNTYRSSISPISTK